MHELLAQVRAAARGMWRFRWAGVAVAWLVAIAATVAIFRIPDRYEGSARIYVDTQSILKPLMSGLAIQPNVEQQVAMLSRTLLTRPTLEKLVRMADLDLGLTTKEQQDALIDDLLKTISISRARGDNIFNLAYKDEDQDKAKRVIQQLVSMFVESSLGASRSDSAQARQFLDEQIRGFEAKLAEAEARILDFRIRNLDVKTTEGGDAATQLATLRGQLQDARLQLREAENMRDSVKAQIRQERERPSAAPRGLLDGLGGAGALATPEIDARIQGHQNNLDQLLQRFTDQHPDVIAVRRLIADLEQQKEREVTERRAALEAAAKEGGPSAADATNPVIAELNRMLATAEVQVSALRGRVGELSSRFEQARIAMREAPAREAEFAAMNRDYATSKNNYETLLARRQKLEMSGELETAAGADFRLIEPPRVTPRPVSPNRLLLLPLALLAGVGAGLAVAFLGSQLRPVFLDGGDLRRRTGLPMLGVVSVVMADADRRRERMDRLRFVGASGSLFLAFGLGLAGLVYLNAL
ncbi:MAG TPA: GNVR domain-containing protein [Rubrivivax sp.]|jgi:polysaccharide chain length determinant protein (PEP-CTERM system associated)|nr:chain length-determining protein [Rhodoferax sp.]MCL4738357.1 chain length-determining protein [Burkholderiaceae bacterium]MCP5288052.1 chain length-determining protein [Burkholderiaceae bacterium]HMR69868.1 GNVR domain-containing protein [Rubrivivax sp.]